MAGVSRAHLRGTCRYVPFVHADSALSESRTRGIRGGWKREATFHSAEEISHCWHTKQLFTVSFGVSDGCQQPHVVSETITAAECLPSQSQGSSLSRHRAMLWILFLSFRAVSELFMSLSDFSLDAASTVLSLLWCLIFQQCSLCYISCSAPSW